jgi:electron transport complex protein RnfG
VFDQFTGATITPRAVVAATLRALQFADAHSKTLFARPGDTREAGPVTAPATVPDEGEQ